MNYCSNCGEPLEEGSLFCSVCGAKAEGAETAVVPAPDPAETAPAGKPKKKHKLWWIAIPAVLLLLAFGAGLYLNLSGNYVRFLPPSEKKFAIITRAALEQALDRALVEKGPEIPESVKANVEASVRIDMKEDDSVGFSESNMILKLINQLKIVADVDIDKTGARLRLNAETGGMKLLEAYLSNKDGKLNLALPDLLGYVYSVDPELLVSELFSAEIPEELEGIADADLLPLDKEKLRAEIMEVYDILMRILDDEDTVIEIRSEKQEIALACADETVTGDVYVITPSEAALKKAIEELADHFDSESSYLGGIIKKLSGSDDVFKEMKSDAAKTAKELYETHFKATIGISGNEVPFMSFDSDESGLYTDHLYKEGESDSRSISVYPNGRNRPTLIRLVYTRGLGSEKTLTGVISLDDDKDDPVFDDLELDGKRLLLTFDLDLGVRSALGTCAGELTLKLGTDELASLSVKPEGERMAHVLKLISPDPEAEMELITVTLYVKEGETVVMPDLPEKVIGSEEELNEAAEEILNALLGSLLPLLLGGYGF